MLQFISENPWVIAVAVGVLFLIIFLLAGYEKAPSDKVFIISGLRKKPKILRQMAIFQH